MRRIEPNIGLKIKFLGIELKFYYGLYSYNLLKYYYEIQCDLVFPIKPLQQLLGFWHGLQTDWQVREYGE